MRFNNKVAIVTGSTRGIGKAIAIQLVKDGAKVIINGTKQETVDEAVKEVGKSGTVYGIAADVSKKADVQRLIDGAVKKFGKLDIMVNNAGIVNFSPFVDLKEEDWDRMLDVDLKGCYLCCQAAAKQMIKQKKGGKILNISSIAGFIGFPGLSHYCAAKAGVIELTKEIATELGPFKINVNAIGPGVIETDMTKDMLVDPKAMKGFLARIPLGRIGKPDDIAKATAFLVSDEADYVTGITLFVDGGWLTQ